MSTQKIITQLYVGYFNRAPDQGGFNYWISRANAGMPIVDIAQSFFVQPEAVAIYGGLDRVPLINLIYANLFRRSPDAAGLNYWLNNGQPIGRMIVDIISGAQGGDLHLLELLTQTARDFAAIPFGPFDLAQARAVLNTVLNWNTPAGANVTIVSPELLPYENILVPAIKRAWLQWGIAGSCEIELAHLSVNVVGRLAQAGPCMETYTGESGVEIEAQTGLDPNGKFPDGKIWITWPDVQQMINSFDLESIMAHEIGHFFVRSHTVDTGNSYSQLIVDVGGKWMLSGPHILAAYGGPIPLQTDSSGNPLPHVTDRRMVMHFSFGYGEVRRVTAWDKAVLRDMGIPVNE